MNPISILKNMLGNFMGNPEQLVRQMVGNNPNPMVKKLMNMAEKGDEEGLKNFAQNVCKEKNMNYENQFNEFSKQLKKEE